MKPHLLGLTRGMETSFSHMTEKSLKLSKSDCVLFASWFLQEKNANEMQVGRLVGGRLSQGQHKATAAILGPFVSPEGSSAQALGITGRKATASGYLPLAFDC